MRKFLYIFACCQLVSVSFGAGGGLVFHQLVRGFGLGLAVGCWLTVFAVIYDQINQPITRL